MADTNIQKGGYGGHEYSEFVKNGGHGGQTLDIFLYFLYKKR